MILPDAMIERRIIDQMMVEPYNEEQLSPASYDLALGDTYRVPVSSTDGMWSEAIRFKKMLFMPGCFYLFHSLETVRIPDDLTAMLFMKSTYCRKGLEHLHACWIDPGFTGQVTFEFTSCWPDPIELEAGEVVAQLVFQQMAAPCRNVYSTVNGHHYQGQTGPTVPWR